MRTASPDIRHLVPLACLLALCIAVAPHPATGPDEKVAGANPDYAAWAALEKGSWVKVRIEGSLRQADWTVRLAELTPEAAVLAFAETRLEGKARDPWQERVPPTLKSKPAEPVESGKATLAVGGQPVECRWETRRQREADGGESGDTTWTSPDVPGFVKRVSWLAADRKAGLPAAKTTETVVGFELRPRAALAAAEGAGPNAAEKPAPPKPVRKAGEGTGPKKFQWTYAFEPRGWRKWEQTGPDTWVERWETGEESRFRIDRRIADRERVGVVVRRLPDEDLETVIPDAGKDAVIWFRQLPDGEWATLGKVESAE